MGTESGHGRDPWGEIKRDATVSCGAVTSIIPTKCAVVVQFEFSGPLTLAPDLCNHSCIPKKKAKKKADGMLSLG
jgi:hypothetical protein